MQKQFQFQNSFSGATPTSGYARQKSKDEWNMHKTTIVTMHHEGAKQEFIRLRLDRNHDFKVTLAQLRRKMALWGLIASTSDPEVDNCASSSAPLNPLPDRCKPEYNPMSSNEVEIDVPSNRSAHSGLVADTETNCTLSEHQRNQMLTVCAAMNEEDESVTDTTPSQHANQRSDEDSSITQCMKPFCRHRLTLLILKFREEYTNLLASADCIGTAHYSYMAISKNLLSSFQECYLVTELLIRNLVHSLRTALTSSHLYKTINLIERACWSLPHDISTALKAAVKFYRDSRIPSSSTVLSHTDKCLSGTMSCAIEYKVRELTKFLGGAIFTWAFESLPQYVTIKNQDFHLLDASTFSRELYQGLSRTLIRIPRRKQILDTFWSETSTSKTYTYRTGLESARHQRQQYRSIFYHLLKIVETCQDSCSAVPNASYHPFQTLDIRLMRTVIKLLMPKGSGQADWENLISQKQRPELDHTHEVLGLLKNVTNPLRTWRIGINETNAVEELYKNCRVHSTKLGDFSVSHFLEPNGKEKSSSEKLLPSLTDDFAYTITLSSRQMSKAESTGSILSNTIAPSVTSSTSSDYASFSRLSRRIANRDTQESS